MSRTFLKKIKEEDVQAQIVDLHNRLNLESILVKIDNETVRGGGSYTKGQQFAYMAKKKKLGMYAGAADLILIQDGQVKFVEVKRPHIKGVQQGGKLSENQLQFMEDVRSLGHGYFVVDNVEDFQKLLR